MSRPRSCRQLRLWKQLVHILTCEEGWVHDLQYKAFSGWHDEDCLTMTALRATKTAYEKRHELICVVSRKSNLTRH